jgi:uncharacterized protein
MSVIKKCINLKLIHPPKFLCDNLIYETIMGSHAYALNKDDSDKDIYGIVIPPKEDIFPHLRGEIANFGTHQEQFKGWQQHHIKTEDTEYDFNTYSIVRFFHLAMGSNPNIIDSLYTPLFCITHNTPIGNMIRERRDMFLSKKAFYTFKSYAFGELKTLKSEKKNSKRKAMIEKYGYDVKDASHLLRLIFEIEQILIHNTVIDLTTNKEQLKAIKSGHYTYEQVIDMFDQKERHLEELYHKCTLPEKPNESKIKEFLLNCLEHHYGNLNDCIKIKTTTESECMLEIKEVLRKHGY